MAGKNGYLYTEDSHWEDYKSLKKWLRRAYSINEFKFRSSAIKQLSGFIHSSPPPMGNPITTAPSHAASAAVIGKPKIGPFGTNQEFLIFLSLERIDFRFRIILVFIL